MTRNRRTVLLVLLALCSAPLVMLPAAPAGAVRGGLAGTAVAAAAAEYRIVDGAMSYSSDAVMSCAFPEGSCTGVPDADRTQSWSLHQSDSVALEVHAPGEWNDGSWEPLTQAPLEIAAWTHSYEERRRDHVESCGGTRSLDIDHSDLQLDPSVPSPFHAALAIAPADGSPGVTVDLADFEATEPRFGWEYPVGLRWGDSSRYPTVLTTNAFSAPSENCSGTSSTRLQLINAFNLWPTSLHDTVLRSPVTTSVAYGAPVCRQDGTCVVRASGSTSYTYDGTTDGHQMSGGAAVTWWFDIESRPQGSGCTSPMYSSYDAFRPYPDKGEAWLHFEVATEWCELPTGEVQIFDVNPRLEDIDGLSGLEFFLAESARFAFSYGDEWRGPTHTEKGNQVTASATLETCLGIPVLGKVKFVKKLPEAFRYLAQVLKQVDGRWEKVADQARKLAKAAAVALEWAIEKGSRAAKVAARQAVRLFEAFLDKLPDSTQLKLLEVTLAAVADYSSSKPAARWFLKTLLWNSSVKIVGSVSDLLVRFLETQVCWKVWKPRIRQTLVPPGGESGEFIDRKGDMPWRVERHSGAF